MFNLLNRNLYSKCYQVSLKKRQIHNQSYLILENKYNKLQSEFNKLQKKYKNLHNIIEKKDKLILDLNTYNNKIIKEKELLNKELNSNSRFINLHFYNKYLK